jgi:hypothetical protein
MSIVCACKFGQLFYTTPSRWANILQRGKIHFVHAPVYEMAWMVILSVYNADTIAIYLSLVAQIS